MSSKRGGVAKGPPKHQNSTTWKPDRAVKKTGSEPGGKHNPYPPITGVCQRCREQIEWRRKYGKYKLLKEPAKCLRCSKRNVRLPYLALCSGCAAEPKVCSKCCKPATGITGGDEATEREEKRRLEEALRSLRERDRRSLLRAMAKGGDTKAMAEKAEKLQTAREDGSVGNFGLSDEDEDDDDEEEDDDDDDKEGDGDGDNEESSNVDDDDDDNDDDDNDDDEVDKVDHGEQRPSDGIDSQQQEPGGTLGLEKVALTETKEKGKETLPSGVGEKNRGQTGSSGGEEGEAGSADGDDEDSSDGDEDEDEESRSPPLEGRKPRETVIRKKAKASPKLR